MANILHIESSSTVCSVALSQNTELIAIKEINNGFTHAENLHVFIEQLFIESGIKISELNAVSISVGPGSYTGLRIGFSAAKGLAYALQIPLIEISTLAAFAFQAIHPSLGDIFYCPLFDARRMEVYTAVYDNQLNEILKPKAIVLDIESIKELTTFGKVCYFGDGMPKTKELLQGSTNSIFIENLMPSSKSMITLAYHKFINNDFADIAYSEPKYIKEFFFTTSKK